MANELGRVKVTMGGFTGSPGMMVFAFQGNTPGLFDAADATAAVAAVYAFINSSKAAFALGVTMQVESEVDVVDWVTGALVSNQPATGVLSVSGTATGNISAAQGVLVQWFTSTVIGRRLLRGRTFLTPSANSA